jgi:hypothetical protein
MKYGPPLFEIHDIIISKLELSQLIQGNHTELPLDETITLRLRQDQDNKKMEHKIAVDYSGAITIEKGGDRRSPFQKVV